MKVFSQYSALRRKRAVIDMQTMMKRYADHRKQALLMIQKDEKHRRSAALVGSNLSHFTKLHHAAARFRPL